MASRSEIGAPTTPAAVQAVANSRQGPARSAGPPGGAGWAAGGLAVLLLSVGNPLFWGAAVPPPWSPPAGLALVLVAWFGWRFASVAVAASGVVLLLLETARSGLQGGVSASALAWVCADSVLTGLEAALAWWLFHGRARGNAQLADPRSAMQFLLLVPGVCSGLAAAVRLLVARQLDLPGALTGGPGLLLALFWLDRALGVLVFAPPLLVLLSPWLKSRGLLRRVDVEPPRATAAPGARAEDLTASRQETPRLGDWVEILGLAICASLLSLILSRLHGRRELMGWQLWGAQILLIVWASLRQGLRGGTLTASASAALPLLARWFWAAPEDPLFQPLLQAHLVAQCSAGLLVSAASSWVRLHETGYRQVVAHVPVVIYSARFTRDGLARQKPISDPDHEPADGLAEVTLVSAASERLLGTPAEQLLGDYSGWLACVHPEDHVVLLAALGQLTRQSEPVTCEYRLAGTVDPDTARRAASPSPRPTRWLRDTLAPHRESDGRLVGWEGVVTDITEQRLLADDLRRTTSMFNALIGNLPTGVFFVQGPHGHPVLVNSRARQLLGTREDFAASLDFLPKVYRLHRPDGTLFPAEELPVYQALKHGRTTMRDDIVVHRPDGRRVPLVTWAAPVHLGQRPSADCAVWVLEDLTALHQAEAARKDTEGRLRAVVETMAEGLVVQDGKGVIVNTNSAAGAFFNRAAGDLLGRTLFDLGWRFVQEDGAPLPRQSHPAEVALRTGRPARHVVIGAHPDGDDPADPGAGGRRFAGRWLLVNAMPLGKGAGVVTTFSDLSAYVHARDAIRASEERYRGLVESLPLMLIQSDSDMRVVYANPAVKAVTGYDIAEIREPEAWAAKLVQEDAPRVFALAKAALAGREDRCELRFRAKDGSEKVCFAMAQPRYQDGVVVGTTTLLLDISRQRQLEKELERARRLELVGRLSSGVAHDFNNLLSVVLNLAELARGHLPHQHPVHADLKRISEAAEQAAGLASQLLLFSKQRPAPARRLDLALLVRRTLDLLRATLPSSISLVEELAPRPLAIHADETQVQQVLMNLCLNARDAMPNGGTLRVGAAWDDGAVRLSVEDTGQGMNDDLRGRIFEPFFSTKDGGTGLGLAVVQQIVESYGGTIEVTSTPGLGSRFTIRWPEA
jgi:PAS domain S-box-containing protein